jgi:hypothetical protein
MSPTEHTLPSSHGLVLLVWTQAPAEQESVVQGLPSLQGSIAPTHWPLAQESPVEHGSLSLQAAPFGRAGLEQIPVVGLHVPALWH